MKLRGIVIAYHGRMLWQAYEDDSVVITALVFAPLLRTRDAKHLADCQAI